MANSRICSVHECSKPHYGLSFCRRHYNRFRQHGDPTAGNALRGAPTEWLLAHADYDGAGCLTWPFGAADKGYGGVRLEGVPMTASRAMCIVAHGPPPSLDMEAAHSCGNGNLGCVHQRHLRWATSLENQADSVEHGSKKGEKAGRAKLTEKQVHAIRALEGKHSRREIGKLFGVSGEAVAGIHSRRNWGWLPD